MTRKLIEFFPELLKETVGTYALADFSPEYGKFVKIIGMARRPDRLRDYAKGSKRVIKLDGEPAQVGYMMNRFKAAELVDESNDEVRDDYRPPSAKTMAATQQTAVARRANKHVKPKPNPEVGK